MSLGAERVQEMFEEVRRCHDSIEKLKQELETVVPAETAAPAVVSRTQERVSETYLEVKRLMYQLERLQAILCS